MCPRILSIQMNVSCGLTMTEAALAQGNKAVATLRKSETLESLQAKYSADKLLVTKLDVTKLDEIESAFSKVKEAFGRIDVIFNHAGWGALGEIEGTPDDQAHAMFEVCDQLSSFFWGTLSRLRPPWQTHLTAKVSSAE